MKKLAEVLEEERKRKRPAHQNRKGIKFVKQGEKTSSVKQDHQGILCVSKSWEMNVDIGRRLVFPGIVQTTLRPDIVIWSMEAKAIIVIELTEPWEEGCEEAYQWKKIKYTELMEMCKDREW